ncbi:hypothetical protein BJ322DRAFT_1112996 [Thelephora terrestris]|uniref:Uncharacterized protein n=1 Tax=Thelephora terrestris TaxID=56493 RepID=A0A9P6H991_9AGAM|nr:hypothetical protein BJ322DRAFT_1112996 [Thelephora terrestris]
MSQPPPPMDPPSTDPYLSVVELYQRLEALTPANNFNPTTSDNECLALLMSARSARDTFLAQRETSRQDVIAARERLKLHEARANHLANTASAVEDFIGEARSRFRARGIPIHPVSIPPRVHHSPTPLDLSSQLFTRDETTATPSEHVQESAGPIFAVNNETSERTVSPDFQGIRPPNPLSFVYLPYLVMQTHSALRRSNRLAPIDSSPPPNDRKHPQDDEPEPNPMAPKKPKKGSGKGKSKSNKRQPPTVNSPAPRSAVNTEFERYGNVSTPTRSDRFVSQPPQSINPASMQGFTANTSTRFNHNLDFTTNQPLIARSHPSPVFTNNHSPGLSTARQIIPPVHYNDASHQLGNSAARLASSPVHLIDIPGRHGLTPVHQTISPIRAVNTPGHLNLNAAHSLPPSVRFIDTPRHPGPAPHQGPSPVHIVETPGRPIPIATHQIPPVHAVNHPGLTTTHTLPPPVRAVNTSDRSQLSYPVHRSHHIGPPSSHVPDLPLPAADRFLDPSPMRITPPNLAQRSGVTALNPQHSQEAEIIDVDELGEDDSSNPSDGEDEESPDDTIEYLAASEQSSASGVKFSPTIVDVLQKHWKTNGRPTLKVGPRPKRVRPEPSPDSRHFYTGPWSKVLDLARNLLIGRVILDYAFPNATDLAADSMECLTDAVATV